MAGADAVMPPPVLDLLRARVGPPREAPPAGLRQPPLAIHELYFATVDMPAEETRELGRVRHVGAADALLDALEDAAVELADRQAGFALARFGEVARGFRVRRRFTIRLRRCD